MQFQSPTEATGDGYWLLLNNAGLSTWGRCRDQYRRADGGPWQFVRRLVRGDAQVGGREPSGQPAADAVNGAT